MMLTSPDDYVTTNQKRIEELRRGISNRKQSIAMNEVRITILQVEIQDLEVELDHRQRPSKYNTSPWLADPRCPKVEDDDLPW
jgi:hypothetical protein